MPPANPPTRARPARAHKRRLLTARQLEIRGDRRAIAAIIAERHTLLAPLTRRELQMVKTGQSVPNAPVRAAVFAWLERENRRLAARAGWADNALPAVTLNELFCAAGFENSHGRRALGMASEGQHRRDRLAGRVPHVARTIKRSHALALAAAMGVDPAEIGL